MTHKTTFVALVALLMFAAACNSQPNANMATRNATPVATPATPTPAPTAPTAQGEPETTAMEVNKAVMVTEELDLGKPVPSIPQGLAQIEPVH